MRGSLADAVTQSTAESCQETGGAHKMSLREVSAVMAAQGYFNERKRPFNPKSIATMLAA
jgi:hypothetical protein